MSPKGPPIIVRPPCLKPPMPEYRTLGLGSISQAEVDRVKLMLSKFTKVEIMMAFFHIANPSSINIHAALTLWPKMNAALKEAGLGHV